MKVRSERISIIIPVLNEEKFLPATLANTQLGKEVEVIVVDGGSQDGSAQLAQSLGMKVLSARGGRASQMNAGALAATGDILLFLHADTLLPKEFDALVRQAMKQPLAIAGAFALRIDTSLFGLRAIESGVNWRSRWLQMPYGDQAIFLKTKVFHDMGGFQTLPIMEDFELMLRLRRKGRIVIISVPVLTSGRRWQKLGVMKTTLINQLVIIAYLLGVPPERIVRWYRCNR